MTPWTLQVRLGRVPACTPGEQHCQQSESSPGLRRLAAQVRVQQLHLRVPHPHPRLSLEHEGGGAKEQPAASGRCRQRLLLPPEPRASELGAPPCSRPPPRPCKAPSDSQPGLGREPRLEAARQLPARAALAGWGCAACVGRRRCRGPENGSCQWRRRRGRERSAAQTRDDAGRGPRPGQRQSRPCSACLPLLPFLNRHHAQHPSLPSWAFPRPRLGRLKYVYVPFRRRRLPS